MSSSISPFDYVDRPQYIPEMAFSPVPEESKGQINKAGQALAEMVKNKKFNAGTFEWAWD